MKLDSGVRWRKGIFGHRWQGSVHY